VVDQRPFRVGLKRFDFQAEFLPHSYAPGIDLRKGHAAVELRLALAQQIQVRPVNNADPHRFRLCSHVRNISRSSSSSSSSARCAGADSERDPPSKRNLASGWACGRGATSASAIVGSQISADGCDASLTASVSCSSSRLSSAPDSASWGSARSGASSSNGNGSARSRSARSGASSSNGNGSARSRSAGSGASSSNGNGSPDASYPSAPSAARSNGSGSGAGEPGSVPISSKSNGRVSAPCSSPKSSPVSSSSNGSAARDGSASGSAAGSGSNHVAGCSPSTGS